MLLQGRGVTGNGANMARYTGILGRVVDEKREQFKERLYIALKVKYQDAYDIDNPEKLPFGGFADISRACGVTQMNVRLWVEGRIFPTDEHIAKLAIFFEMSEKKFLGTELAKYYTKGT